MQSFQKQPLPQTLPVGSIRMALAQDTAASWLQGQDIHVSSSPPIFQIGISLNYIFYAVRQSWKEINTC